MNQSFWDNIFLQMTHLLWNTPGDYVIVQCNSKMYCFKFIRLWFVMINFYVTMLMLSKIEY